MSIGKVGDAWVLASETCAFDLIHAKFVRDVEPGEILMELMVGVEPGFWGPEPLFPPHASINIARNDNTTDKIAFMISLSHRLTCDWPLRRSCTPPSISKRVTFVLGVSVLPSQSFENSLLTKPS